MQVYTVQYRTLKTRGRQLDNPAITGDTGICRNDNLRRQQRRQSYQIDNPLPSVYVQNRIASTAWYNSN